MDPDPSPEGTRGMPHGLAAGHGARQAPFRGPSEGPRAAGAGLGCPDAPRLMNARAVIYQWNPARLDATKLVESNLGWSNFRLNTSNLVVSNHVYTKYLNDIGQSTRTNKSSACYHPPIHTQTNQVHASGGLQWLKRGWSVV